MRTSPSPTHLAPSAGTPIGKQYSFTPTTNPRRKRWIKDVSNTCSRRQLSPQHRPRRRARVEPMVRTWRARLYARAREAADGAAGAQGPTIQESDGKACSRPHVSGVCLQNAQDEALFAYLCENITTFSRRCEKKRAGKGPGRSGRRDLQFRDAFTDGQVAASRASHRRVVQAALDGHFRVRSRWGSRRQTWSTRWPSVPLADRIRSRASAPGSAQVTMAPPTGPATLSWNGSPGRRHPSRQVQHRDDPCCQGAFTGQPRWFVKTEHA